MEFKVDLIKIWKHRAIFLSFLLSFAIFIIFIFRFLVTGLSIEKTFQHITVTHVPLLFLAAIIVSIIGGFMVTLPYKYESITVLDKNLVGRSSWNFKKPIPYSSIREIDRHSRIAHEQILIDAGEDGKVHISTHIENLEELISLIESKIQPIDSA